MDIKTFKPGWLKDKPDSRDYRYTARPEVIAVLPPAVDLRSDDTPVEDQGALGSCTAHAGTAIFEWLQKHDTGNFIQASRSFLYKEAQDVDGIVGDDGAYLRSVAKVLADEGVPPESLWPYSFYPREPTAAIKAAAIQSHADSYWRVDGNTFTETLNNMRAAMATNDLPVMLGFTCYEGAFSPESDGMIPIPGANEASEGGHAVAAMGYSDTKKALLIRNSWGVGWGVNGYGWLPYWYVNNGLVDDCWVIATESEIVIPPTPPTPPEPQTLCDIIWKALGG